MSNSSKIEQFIRENRTDFDTATPSPQCWAGVENALDRFPAADPLERQILFHRSMFDSNQPPQTVWDNITQALNHATDNTLEGFIRQNRPAFDTREPGPGVWASIEKAVPAKTAKIVRAHWRYTIMRVAAALALLIAGVNIGIWYAGFNGSEQAGMAMSDVSAEYAELEQYYQRDISAKQEKLASFASYRDQDVTDDLLQMDNVMDELRDELANVPPGNREKVVRAMIENYKAKAAILGRVLQHLEQIQPNQQQPATTNSSNHEVESI